MIKVKVGVETFAEIAPFIFERETQFTAPITFPTTQIIKEPTTGKETQVTYAPYSVGQALPNGVEVVRLPSGQRVTRRVQKAGVLPKWGLPLLLLGGGMLIMGRRKR